MSIRERISNLRERSRNKIKDEHGMTIVEVLVAFALVLMCIAMLTASTQMASRIQAHSQEYKKQTTLLAEAAYVKFQPVYDSTNQVWVYAKPSGVSNVSVKQTLTFTSADGKSFGIDVHTADLEVTTQTEDGSNIRADFSIYQ